MEDESTYNSKPINLHLPGYELPTTGVVVMHKNAVWRNQLFHSTDRAILHLRFAFPNVQLYVINNIISGKRIGKYELFELTLVKNK